MGMFGIFVLSLIIAIGAAARTGSNDLASKIEMELDKPQPEAPLATPLSEAEDQTPTGKYTTATEVKPILSMTKQSWVAVRDYDGQDLVYFTNLLAWRCGVMSVQYSVNDGPLEELALEPCYSDEATPNALKMEEFLPYVTQPQGSVETVRVVVQFDDLTSDEVTVLRKDVLTP
jgi:hypothetical protein